MFVLTKLETYAQTNSIALINREESLSYAELYKRTKSFANWLLANYGNNTTPVLIYGNKEINFLPCLYGSLMAGHAYVPVDISTPLERIGEIIDTILPIVIVDFSSQIKADAHMLNNTALENIFLTSSAQDIPKENWVQGESLAYILFTSGSTGKPKGVPITANNLTNLYHGIRPYMDVGGVILNQISYSFDVSVLSIYIGINQGMTLFTIDHPMVSDLGMMFDYLSKSGLTIWVSTPSFAELCIHSKLFSAKLLPNLQKILFCGEVLTHKLCDQLTNRFPTTQILNTYGPTEATVLVTAVWITKELRENKLPIPIGAPLKEVLFQLIDNQGAIVEQDNVHGELIIISDSVGPGYYNQPVLTDAHFYEDLITKKRSYRTGDICFRKDGLYYYHGRVDNQLKLHGHRIELEDIESNLQLIQNVSGAVVVPVWEDNKVSHLVAFLRLEEPDNRSQLQISLAIKKLASTFLPNYMIPHKFVTIDTFPLNKNGKVDRKEIANRLAVKDK